MDKGIEDVPTAIQLSNSTIRNIKHISGRLALIY